MISQTLITNLKSILNRPLNVCPFPVLFFIISDRHFLYFYIFGKNICESVV